MSTNDCVLKLSNLYYEEFNFKRDGAKNDIPPQIRFNVQIAEPADTSQRQLFKVILGSEITKEAEYFLKVVISGVFEITKTSNTEKINDLLRNNAVAILMPYVRTQVSLLTAQPGTECIVLPPFNINEMMHQSSDNSDK